MTTPPPTEIPSEAVVQHLLNQVSQLAYQLAVAQALIGALQDDQTRAGHTDPDPQR